MVAKDGGGAAGLTLDYGALEASRCRLDTAAEDFDAVGQRAPQGGDYGAAGPLVALVLGAYAETAARLVAEASVIGVAIAICSSDVQITDSQQAIDLLTPGSA